MRFRASAFQGCGLVGQGFRVEVQGFRVDRMGIEQTTALLRTSALPYDLHDKP